MLVEVADLHVFTHDDTTNSPEKCVWCQISHAQVDLTAVLPTPSVEIVSPSLLENSYKQPVYTYEFSTKPSFCDLYNKPPPSIKV